MNPLIGQTYIFCFTGAQVAITGEVIDAEPGWRTVRGQTVGSRETEDFMINLAHVVHYRHATK